MNMKSSPLFHLIILRENFIFNNKNITFNDTPTAFPPAITMSSIATPYMTHNDSPTIKTMINHSDTSSIFFVFIPLIIWGTVLETANKVANIPISAIKKLNIPDFAKLCSLYYK